MIDDYGNEYYQVVESGILKTINAQTSEVVQEEIISDGDDNQFEAECKKLVAEYSNKRIDKIRKGSF